MSDLDKFQDFVAHSKSMARRVAAQAFPTGATVRCSCGYTRILGTDDCGHALKHGWPMHCGQTMSIVSVTTTPEV